MALEYGHGTIEWLTTDAATATYVVSSLTFQPKALMFWCTGIASAGVDANNNTVDQRNCVGFAVGTSDRRAAAAYDDNGAGTSDCSACVWNDCVVATLDNAGARSGALDLTALASNGFTLTVDDQLPDNNVTVFWAAWGGDDISVAVVGDFNEPTTGGTVSPTVTGFTSGGENQVVLFAGTQSTSAVNTPTVENGGLSFGVCTGTAAANEWCVATSVDHGSAATDTDGLAGTGKVVAQAPLAGGTAWVAGNLTSWGTDGFTLTFTGTAVTNRKTAFLAIKGGAWQAGSYTIAGNSASATATVSGLPLAPKGVIIAGAMKTEESAVTGTVEARKSIGTATGISSRRALGWLSENATASSNVEVDHTAEFDSVLAFPSTGGALQSAYDIDAWNADGFRIIVDTAGGVASEWQGYLAFGDGPPKHFLVMAPPAPAPIAEQR